MKLNDDAKYNVAYLRLHEKFASNLQLPTSISNPPASNLQLPPASNL
jgi:hypothetical protein